MHPFTYSSEVDGVNQFSCYLLWRVVRLHLLHKALDFSLGQLCRHTMLLGPSSDVPCKLSHLLITYIQDTIKNRFQ